MLLLPSKHLVPLLSLLFTLLTIHQSHSSQPKTPSAKDIVESRSQPIVDTLAEDHDLSPDFTLQVLGLFGEVIDGMWQCNVLSMIKEVGRGLLEGLSGHGISSENYLSDWEGQSRRRMGRPSRYQSTRGASLPQLRAEPPLHQPAATDHS